MKDKIEVEMLSPLMAEFIPDYSDIVDLDDAEPLEGPDLVQYQTSIAEKNVFLNHEFAIYFSKFALIHSV